MISGATSPAAPRTSGGGFGGPGDDEDWCSVRFLASPPEDLVMRSRSVGITPAELASLRAEAEAHRIAALEGLREENPEEDVAAGVDAVGDGATS